MKLGFATIDPPPDGGVGLGLGVGVGLGEGLEPPAGATHSWWPVLNVFIPLHS